MEKPMKRPLWPTLLLAVVVGTVAFGIIHGYAVLDPTRDNWILQNYSEDLVQHYAGWCAFQKSPWHFPLGLADKMAYGTYITYTDSIPLVAILLKFLLQLVGYGGYSMNLNGPFNPTSAAGYTWSAFLPHLPMPSQNDDGFTYLGVGVLLLVVGCLVALVVRRRLGAFLRRNWFYLVAMLGMTLFALSNVVMFNDQVVLTVPLPENVLYLCGIFRASSRMFYPVIYTMMVWSTGMLCGQFEGYRRQSGWRSRPALVPAVLLTAAVVLQLYDLHGAIAGLHAYMAMRLQTVSIEDDAQLLEKLSQYEILAWDPDHESGDRRALVLCALKSDMTTLYSVANTGIYPYVRANEENAEKWAALQQGQTSPDTVYETTDAATAQQLADLNPTAELLQFENFYLLFPQKS